jgi:redox-sensing transcriptional repressor
LRPEVGAIREVVVARLPLYIRVLSRLEGEKEIVSSQELGYRLQLSAAQIRKDLSLFGKFGKQGRGYDVSGLLGALRRIMGLDREWAMVLVGVGRLGRAVLDYGRFTRAGFRIVAAFDIDQALVGKRIGGVLIQDVTELGDTVHSKGVRIGIVSAPASQAQGVVDSMVGVGIKAILNYAPVAARVPPGVRLRDIDPVMAAQSITFYLREESPLEELMP